MENQLVSIIIPSYKNTEKLRIALDSALHQSYKNIEVIVVDDNQLNSEYSNKTKQIVSGFQIQYGNIIYVSNNGNKERSYSRNHGVKNAHGYYIAFMDNDDEYLPTKIESQVNALESYNGEYAICYSNYQRRVNGKIKVQCGETRSGSPLFDVICRNFFVHAGSNLLIKRSAFEEIGGFDEQMNINEDIDLLYRLLQNNKILYCNTVGLIVNIHKHIGLDYIEKTNTYIHKVEKTYLKNLTDEEIKRFYTMMGLQLFRFSIRNNIKNASRLKKQYRLTTRQILCYSVYLLKRRITGRAYSFNLS